MTEKWTPAPWRVVPRGSGRGGPLVVRGGEGGFMVAGLSPEREDADARLIAAAPDMAEALAEIIAVAERRHPAPAMAIQKCRAALDAVRGDE